MTTTTHFRRTSQELLPTSKPPSPAHYDLYPAHDLGSHQIALGFEALAESLCEHLAGQRAGEQAGPQTVTLDGYAGVLWDELRAGLDAALIQRGVRATWRAVDTALRPPAEIEALIAPFLGGDDPLFGARFTGALADFFDADTLAALGSGEGGLTVVYGCGAALARCGGPLVYVDLPKNELQFRARAGLNTNLGASQAAPAKAAYKRSYFVDWPALNAHKAALLPHIDYLVDGQRPGAPTMMSGETLRGALSSLSTSFFRVRPWFEPGPWGGQWLKREIPELPQDVPNYAWSFELIVPENGLLFSSDGLLLEVSFDALMFHAHGAVLGEAAARFGHEFPIRFDFLDTVGGGNLSLQVHPREEYIREQFGERFTQDETYYILHAEEGAGVYLGFQEGVDAGEFRRDLRRSLERGSRVNVEQYVQRHPARRGDLFLIPSGTVHCSGAGSVVLEISATPYIFTFKLYDWLRLDLEGKPRPLNLERAFDNLVFERRGERARRELRSAPRLLGEGDGWQRYHLPTHEEHFYDVRRLEFDRAMKVDTDGQCHVLSLVEGEAVVLEVGGQTARFAFAETFVVPAAALHYRLVNAGAGRAKVVQAFVKPGRGPGSGTP